MTFGPRIRPEGVEFSLWAPSAESVCLVLPDRPPIAMAPQEGGFFSHLEPGTAAGQRYMFEIAGQRVPDPASRLQEADVEGWSVVCERRRRSDLAAKPGWAGAVICEVHVGTATPEGTFAALAERLPHFRDAGYTVIELMPITDFVGARNWGYDGVLLYAPDRAYGSPEDLVALIDRAHALGMGMMLDVVYNHFGPAGNFLPAYAAQFFDRSTETPWGAAIDFDNPIVRLFFVENACLWIEEYGFDGLRLDAVHALAPAGREALLREVAAAVRLFVPAAHLVLENERNERRWLEREGHLTSAHYTAQWNDDYHHAFHVLATGETDGYYGDYAEAPLADAERALREGFVYQGQESRRAGGPRGERSAGLHPAAFVAFHQNHDQIGNRAQGDRLTTLAGEKVLSLLRFVLLLGPQIPLFFMGEEFGAMTPFAYFCDFDGELGEAVRSGRAREFAGFVGFAGFGEGGAEGIPDPLAIETFERSKLDWADPETPAGRQRLQRFRALCQFRQMRVVPLLETPFLGAETTRVGSTLHCLWKFEAGALELALNAAERPGVIDRSSRLPLLATEGEIAIAPDRVELGGWSAVFWGGA